MVKINSLDDLFVLGIFGKSGDDQNPDDGHKDSGDGHYVILPRGTRILNTLYSKLKRYLVGPLHFEEVVLQKMAPVSTFETAEILGKWDNYLLSVVPYSTTKGVETPYILDPLQCTVFYEFFRGKSVNSVRWYDTGPSYRNEDKSAILPGIKQREFHRAEFVYIGKPEEVTYVREQGISQLEQLCQTNGLQYRVVEGTGCYEFDTDPQVSIRDLEVYIPFLDMWLEVVGCSVLGNNMTKRFNIRATDESELWSGCIGVGMERLLVSMLSYHDLENLLLRCGE